MLPPHLQLRPTLPAKPSGDTTSCPSPGCADVGATAGKDQSVGRARKGSIKSCHFLLSGLWRKIKPQLTKGWVSALPPATTASSHSSWFGACHPLNQDDTLRFACSYSIKVFALFFQNPTLFSLFCQHNLFASAQASPLCWQPPPGTRCPPPLTDSPEQAEKKENSVPATPSPAWAGLGNFSPKTKWEARAASDTCHNIFCSTVGGQQKKLLKSGEVCSHRFLILNSCNNVPGGSKGQAGH